MKVLFLTRSTLYTVFGGDTVQVEGTARYLRRLGVTVDIRLAHERIDYSGYDLVHVFNLIRPADSLRHVRKSGKPYVLSTIYVDYSESEKTGGKGLPGLAAKLLSPDRLQYLKVVMRMIRNGEKIQSPAYLWLGHRRSVRKLAGEAALLLPNSESEIRRVKEDYGVRNIYMVIPNGIDTEMFETSYEQERDEKLIICVARIEARKNQLELIRAVNGTDYKLILIGRAAPNHRHYYETCRKAAGDNVSFAGFVPQEALPQYYGKAKVHVLPSWHETTGLSTLEAAYHGCNVVITGKGDTREYFGNSAWYCDPADAVSIREAIAAAASAPPDAGLREKILTSYNWKAAATRTLSAYKSILKQPC